MGKQVAVKSTAGLVATMAGRHGIDEEAFKKVVMKTAFKGEKNVTAEEFYTFLMVANEYDLDPFLGQIFAFPSRGGIVPFVGIDGWIDLINRQPRHNGLEVVEVEDPEDPKIPQKVTVKIHVKGYDHPVVITERFAEVRRDTVPWKSHPFRMTRHKAIIQCARVAYGFSGLYDEDEARRILEARGEIINGVITTSSSQIPPVPLDPGQVVEHDAPVAPEEPQEEKKAEAKGKGKATQEKPAEGSTGPEKGKIQNIRDEEGSLFGDPEVDELRANIRELAEALDYDAKEVETMLPELADLKGHRELKATLQAEYNSKVQKGKK